tara:strand:+ start:487 stop:1206 length:720 start_codon:yes stop_codon:yes gene_type:complete
MTTVEHFYNIFGDIETGVSSVFGKTKSSLNKVVSPVDAGELTKLKQENSVLQQKYQTEKSSNIMSMSALQNQYNSLKNLDTAKINSLQNDVNEKVDTIGKLTNDLEKETRKFDDEEKRYNIEKDRFEFLQGKVLNKADSDEKVVRSAYFKALKEKYLNQLKVVEYQESLLNRQSIALKNRNATLKEKKNEYDTEYDKVSTMGRVLLYNEKDLGFYNTASNILKVILIFIAIAVIYLLLN